MKKEDVSGLIVYLIIIIFAIVFGLTVLQQHVDESSSVQAFLILNTLWGLCCWHIV